MKFIHDNKPSYELTYSDVFLVPQKSDINSRLDVNIMTEDGTGNQIPIVVANMNAVAGKRMAETVARRGGIAVLPQDLGPDVLKSIVSSVQQAHPIYETPITLTADNTVRDALELINKRAHGAIIIVDTQDKPVGILTKTDISNQDVFTKLSDVATVDVVALDESLSHSEMYDRLISSHIHIAPVTKDEKLIGAVTRKSIMRSQLYKPNLDDSGKLNVAVAIGINGDVAAKAQKALDLGVNTLVIDTAHGHQAKMINAVKAVRNVSADCAIVAGNVVTAEATKDLLKAGANIVKVGVGPGAMCTTRMMTGVGRPQFSAVLECAEAAHKLGGHVWADGGVRHPRDVALALAAGASNVMFGSWLAGTYESAADIKQDRQGRLYKENFGMASRRAVSSRNTRITGLELAKKQLFEEGISSSKMYLDPKMPGVEDIIDHITAGVRSACSYEGARNLAELRDKSVVGVQSSSGYQEGKPVSTSW